MTKKEQHGREWELPDQIWIQAWTDEDGTNLFLDEDAPSYMLDDDEALFVADLTNFRRVKQTPGEPELSTRIPAINEIEEP